MSLKARQIELATSIDKFVNDTYAKGGTDADVLANIYDYMGVFRELLDTSSRLEMDELCQRFEGFYRFAQILEQIAQGIANGTISVPK